MDTASGHCTSKRPDGRCLDKGAVHLFRIAIHNETMLTRSYDSVTNMLNKLHGQPESYDRK
jgi:hypothetical protein